jgi:hypothetical protein
MQFRLSEKRAPVKVETLVEPLDTVNTTDSKACLLLAAILLLAGTAFRAHQLSELTITGDEVYTLMEARDAFKAPEDRLKGEAWRLRWAYRTNPLHARVSEFGTWILGNGALAVRIFPFLFGVLSLIVLPWYWSRLTHPRAALVLLALLVFCPLHVDFSRFARYQSATFLFGGITVLATLCWCRYRRPVDGIVAIVASLLVTGFHVASLITVSSILLFLILSKPNRYLIVTILVALAISGYVLRDPINRTIYVVRHGIDRPTTSPPAWKLTASLIYGLGPFLVLTAGLAVISGLRRFEPKALCLTAVALIPLGALGFMSNWYSVGVRYYASAAASVVLLAAYGISRSWSGGANPSAKRLAFVTGFVCLSQAPLLVSDQMDGQRYDYVSAGQFLNEQAQEGDLILASWHGILDIYTQHPTQEFEEKSVDWIRQTIRNSTASRAYLVLQRQRGRLVFGSEQQPLEDWLENYAIDRTVFGRRRLDARLYCFEIEVVEISPSQIGDSD